MLQIITQTFFEKCIIKKNLIEPIGPIGPNYENINFFDICVIICNKVVHKNFLKKLKGKKVPTTFRIGPIGPKCAYA